jgi:hypothetical protein
MLNPDGVYHGHYRMDIFNQNLNRFYNIATYDREPGIFALRNLVDYMETDKRLFFYCGIYLKLILICNLRINITFKFLITIRSSCSRRLTRPFCLWKRFR